MQYRTFEGFTFIDRDGFWDSGQIYNVGSDELSDCYRC